MAQQQAGSGTQWAGFSPGTVVDAEISGVFRASLIGDTIRVVEGKYGKQFQFTIRVHTPNAERPVTVWCPFNTSPRSKMVSILKAVNGISGDLPAGFDLSTLETEGDLAVQVETNDRGYLDIVNWMPLQRDARGVPVVPGAFSATASGAEVPF